MYVRQDNGVAVIRGGRLERPQENTSFQVEPLPGPEEPAVTFEGDCPACVPLRSLREDVDASVLKMNELMASFKQAERVMYDLQTDFRTTRIALQDHVTG